MVDGGMTQALSPEWIRQLDVPMIEGTKARCRRRRRGPRLNAFSRNLSMSTDDPGSPRRRRDVLAQHLPIVNDLHAAPAEDVGGPDHQRVADSSGDPAPLPGRWRCLFSGWGIPRRRITAANASPSSARSMLLREVPRIFHAPGRQLLGQVQRRLAAKLDDDALRLSFS